MRLPHSAALLVIDVQCAIDHPSWGERNNPLSICSEGCSASAECTTERSKPESGGYREAAGGAHDVHGSFSCPARRLRTRRSTSTESRKLVVRSRASA
jgi:hypothetical protein